MWVAGSSRDWPMSVCSAWEYRLDVKAASNVKIKPVKLVLGAMADSGVLCAHRDLKAENKILTFILKA